jgi:nucleolar MIF4G domain-containing protein 1
MRTTEGAGGDDDDDSEKYSSDEDGATDGKHRAKQCALYSADSHDDDDDNRDPDSDLAAAIRMDDQEIASLEKKLGLSKKKEKEKLYKEYSKEGYGDDFGSFLDDLDDMLVRLKHPSTYLKQKPDDSSSTVQEESNDDSDGSDDEELVPMKSPDEDLDEDDSVLEELERMQQEGELYNASDPQSDDPDERCYVENDDVDSEDGSDEQDRRSFESENDHDDSSSSSDSDEDEQKEEPDHDGADTYRPSKGEDIYGNKIDSDSDGKENPSKYVPPHLRKKREGDDEAERERRKLVNRSLNNALNRLSEDTLISVAQQVAQVYSSNPSQLVHELIWKNAKDACVGPPMIMSGLIPLYTGCIIGVHFQTGDTVQVGETILENVVTDLWDRLKSWRNSESNNHDGQQREMESKQICNLVLILGYLYNFNVVHCSLMYDVVRHLIESFSEVDIECLLILLSHCGRSLRSDDPLALKEIVLLVQKKNSQNAKVVSSSRADYMISAIMDLKNNRRKKQDTVYSEQTIKFRKILGQIKSSAAKSGVSKSSSEASLRISLNDILNAETKGRWWKVGASWVGNQYRFSDNPQKDKLEMPNTAADSAVEREGEDEYLLKIATKLRMNTDRKRAIFCIIMGGTDCEDTFEKLCRSSMLQNRSERDTIRVLLECCGHEKSYNKFYGHLASRICEYQPQSKFSLQLAYWDAFKQFDSMGTRKVANLARLLFHLIVVHQTLKILPVIKTIDISDEDMDENALIFLTILFSNILEHFDDASQVRAMFTRHVPNRSEDLEKNDDRDEGVRAGLLVFFMETLKSSPKNTKGSRFRKNFKAVVKELDTDGFESMF